ncbi:MAG: site-2 protease family protein [Methanosarcinaceae archaeon]|nr:site-2 protease family protein [Methanosarcinaceae archaeon]
MKKEEIIMENSYQIARILDIPIKIHISFLLVLPFFAWMFAIQPEPFGFAGIESAFIKYILSLMTAILLFVSVLIHELAHSYFSLRYGGSISEITLYLIGGVSAMEGELRDPSNEAKMAFVGPFSSIIIGIFLLLLNYVFSPAISLSDGNPFFLMIFILGYINIILGLFNLIPAFPMDGGRILRAFLAQRMGFVEATEKAAFIGKILAFAMGLFGLFTSFWLILIAFFIYMGASGEEQQVRNRYEKYN